jgi:hypothetical protein
MPLRDHFRPPYEGKTSWDLVHGMWPASIVLQLNKNLPPQYTAGPMVHLGSEIEIDVAAFEKQAAWNQSDSDDLEWQTASPCLAVETEFMTVDDYEVRVYDILRNRRLVAAIELVSPSNKDRPESRQVFVAKCRALLRQGVSVTIVDIVTAKQFNLYTELLALAGQTDPTMPGEPPSTYAAACRWIPRGRKHVLETWSHTLHLDQPLPTLPLWLAENFAVPLELEATYEHTCQALRITP